MAKKQSTDRPMRAWITVACAAVILLFGISAFMVLDLAGQAANRFSGAAEKKLVQLEFQNQVEAAVQYQAQISFWDATVAQLNTGRFSETFVKQSITDWMWPDFNFIWMVFVDGERKALLSTKEGTDVGPEASGTLLAVTGDLFEAAKARYAAALRPAAKGWRIEAVRDPRDALTAPLPYIHVSDIRRIDGIMSIVVVQAVVAKSLEVPVGRTEPTFLVSVKPVTAKMLANMELRLGVSDLHFGIATAGDADARSVSVGSLDTGYPSTVFWTSNAPLDFVWKTSTPVVAGLCLLAAVVMIFIAFRFGRTVDALQASEEKNFRLARHDALTGLVNRAGFDEALKASIAKAAPFALICLDLDRFKAVNDRYGHPAGDAVLKDVAGHFAARVADRGIVARMGGDEFVVLLDHAAAQADALSIARGLVIDAQIPIPFDGTLLQVGASAGVGQFPHDGDSARSLMAAADGALYAAKTAGRNCAITAEPPVERQSRAA